MKRIYVVAMICFFLFVGTNLSFSKGDQQESGVEVPHISSEQNKIKEYENKFSDINEYKSKLEEMRKRMHGLPREQQFALGLQIRETEIQLRKIFERIVEYIQKEKNENILDPDILAKIKSLMQEESKIIQKEIEYNDNYIKSLMDDQNDLDAIQLFARRQEIINCYKVYDGLLEDFFENSKRLQSLNLPTHHDLDLLDSLLKHRSLIVVSEIKLILNKLPDLKRQYKNASKQDKDNIHSKIVALEEYKEGLTDSLTLLINLQQQRKINVVEYSELLIKATGKISSKIFDKKVAFSLVSHLIDTGKTWVKANALKIFLNLLSVLLILILFRILAWLARRLLQKTFKTSKVSNLAGNFLLSISGKIVMGFGTLVALTQLGFKIGPLLAGLGIAGFIVGFALQDVLSNFASGVMILMYQPFDMGDTIEVPEVSGRVQSMNLVSTIILTYDNQKLIVPNNKIWGNIIRNIHSEKIRRVDLVFGIAYEADIDHAEKIFQEILENHELVLKYPEYNIKLHNLGESSVDFIVRPWTVSENYWDVYWDITRIVKKRLDEEGISIPYPQRDVHIHHC